MDCLVARSRERARGSVEGFSYTSPCVGRLFDPFRVLDPLIDHTSGFRRHLAFLPAAPFREHQIVLCGPRFQFRGEKRIDVRLDRRPLLQNLTASYELESGDLKVGVFPSLGLLRRLDRREVEVLGVRLVAREDLMPGGA